ncbi:hypothetical protein JQX08_05235 [Pseudomonas sp. UL073]|uniref:DUF4760 domain-containing protein n=1 Tax=Zestomonas insulae TaxID=2809017 RepID=A0ABS2ICS4_9GAMM|nr:hypothetical protein [Pseudomonas insulae]MBM7060104.1 hypothetical protein [Pseudomonas insulae]
MDFKQVMDIATFASTILTGVASIVIPVILYRSQKQKATLDYIKAGRDSWIQIDLGLLDKPVLLRQAESILSPGAELPSDEAIQRKWLALMILNVAFSDFIGLKYGYHELEERDKLFNLIKGLMADEGNYRLSQQAYNEEFRQECRKAREAVTGLPVDAAPAAHPLSPTTLVQRSALS